MAQTGDSLPVTFGSSVLISRQGRTVPCDSPGGLLGDAADNALTFAAGAVAGPGVLTAGCTIDVLAPVVGDRLLARAWVISAGQRLIVTRCELIEPRRNGNRLSAIAQGTIARTTS
jgi:acyl-coenzyme A thioesterase PaaI-like protein